MIYRVLNTPLQFEQSWISICIIKSRTYIKKDTVSAVVTNRGGSRTAATAKIERFVIIVNG